MSRLVPAIFIIAFTTISGVLVVAMLVMGKSEPVHFFSAVVLGALIAGIASIVISKQMKP